MEELLRALLSENYISFSALSVEPLNGGAGARSRTGRQPIPFSALSVEPLNGDKLSEWVATFPEQSFSALSVEPLNGEQIFSVWKSSKQNFQCSLC